MIFRIFCSPVIPPFGLVGRLRYRRTLAKAIVASRSNMRRIDIRSAR